MADRFPELYSHCRIQEMTVRQAVNGAIMSSMVPRLSEAAQVQLTQVNEIIEQQ
jgi:hypothetical protein